ncbi:glycosyltransferase [Desulfosporosinus sp. Sb-LF]|nr:glycosyltransferase [Desulfosporosinus sp. Sb-LF]
MKISLCMIVKNEEDVLQQSLNKVGRYVDEIIVVDTGSTDRTKEIALTFTEKVYDFTWCDDFSAARNFSLEKASCDWVLVLDADEVITNFNVGHFWNVIKSDKSVVGRIRLIDIVSDATGEKRCTERISRLFNRRLFHYEGIIHEQIVKKDGNSFNTVPVEITVEHSGYTQEVIQRTDKIARNITLLEQALEKNPEDAYMLYQLAKTYYMAKSYKDAVYCFKRALALPLDFSLEYVKNLVETYGYALINSGSYGEAMCLKNYEKYYASSTDYQFLMALISMNNGRFSQAIEQFMRCIDNKEGKVEGTNSYLPKFNIAVIYECLGYRAEAVRYYEKCENYPAALKRLREI